MVAGVQEGHGWSLGAGMVFGITVGLLYAGSTLYHSIPFPRARHVFKIIDHSAIYLLIAGTYTPFCIVTLRDVTEPFLKTMGSRTVLRPVAGPVLSERESPVAPMDSRELAA